MRKEIGKIQKIKFGYGGYQDAMIGVSFTLGGESWGVSDFWGAWAGERCESTQWSEQDRINTLGETSMRISKILDDSKKKDLNDMLNVPIECTFDGNLLKSWRILTEVI